MDHTPKFLSDSRLVFRNLRLSCCVSIPLVADIEISVSASAASILTSSVRHDMVGTTNEAL